MAGRAARSRQRVGWRVKLWTDLGGSEWSEPAWFETGLLDGSDWVAEWIEPHEPVRVDAGARPAYQLRHRFELDSGSGRAPLRDGVRLLRDLPERAASR